MILVIHLSFCTCEDHDDQLLTFKQSFEVGLKLRLVLTKMAAEAHRHSLCHVFLWLVFRVRPLSDGSNPWSTSLVKSQKSVPLAALFAEQGELKIHSDAACFKI